MRKTVKVSDLCTDLGVEYDWAVREIEANFSDSLILSNNEHVIFENAFEKIYDFLSANNPIDEVSEDEIFEQEDEVLLITEACARAGVDKQVFFRAIKRAQANGFPLPNVKILRDGNRGRPRFGYTCEFVDKIKQFMQLPRSTSFYGCANTNDTIAKEKSTITADFSEKRILGKFDESLQTLFSMLSSAKEDGVTKEELANKLDISPKILNSMLTDLQNRGYNLTVTNNSAGLDTNFTADYSAKQIEWGTNGTYKVGFVSDLHACCEYTKIKSAQKAYEQFSKQGVSIVFNAGDTTHGHVDMHGSYKYEIKLRMLENQLNHLVADYPKQDGIQTFMIAGNHDLSWGRQGVDFIKLLSDRRPDITYLGPTVAFIDGPDNIPNFVMLYHPKDGSGYALSYKTQKIAEYVTYALKGLTDNPDIPNIMPQIASIGHYHKYVHHKGPDGAHYITCPALCGMTDFQKGKHLINEMGALMFEFGLSDKGKIDFWSIKGFDVEAGKEVLYVEEQYTSPRISISGFWKKNNDGGII